MCKAPTCQSLKVQKIEYLNNSDLEQRTCGDAIPYSAGMLTLQFGRASDQLSNAPTGNTSFHYWFGSYRCNMGEELRRFKNAETYVAYFMSKGSFKILSEGQTKTIGAGTCVGFPPQTEYES